MYTPSIVFRRRWTFIVFFVALQMALLPFSSAFAFPVFSPPQREDVARAGVSIVRLVVTYTTTDTAAPVVQCTGLGALVGSWPARNKNDQNNWILTDGSLFDSNTSIACTGKQSLVGKLSSVAIFLSNAYNPNPQLATIPVISISDLNQNVHCQHAQCSAGPALFSFNYIAQPALPFMKPSLLSPGAVLPLGIGLAKNVSSQERIQASNTNFSQQQDFIQQAATFLTPNSNLDGSRASEPGTPFVDSDGRLAGLYLASNNTIAPLDTIRQFVGNQPDLQNTPPNQLQRNWDDGITDFYNKDYAKASSEFQQAAAENLLFSGAKDFAAFANTAAFGTGKQPRQTGGITFADTFIPYWLLSVIGLLGLIVILLLTSIVFGRARAHRQLLKAELAEAERKAAVDAQRIREMEAAQLAQSQQPLPVAPPPPAVAPAPTLRCPRCNSEVPRDANYCSHCQLLLSPSVSGLHLRIPQQPRSVDIPTMVPAASIADQPTVDMSPSPGASRNGTADLEKTVPYTSQQGKRLGIIVATRTNPGIKRKHKPNEDSVFAGQGLREVHSSPEPFGLFVVADGMGGHANGQDASRLAIQTIIDYILPKLWNNEDPQEDVLKQLLVEGVQSANRAVHQQNMEQHGDMGTTITAALIVDATAYVANVGDSRTYLYRGSEGLKKITQDHSVVASLVEAGIIKPDDIYTHPKRNQIYRSLGEKPLVEVDSFTVQLQESDELLLCSDGLWDMVRDPKIEEVIKESPSNLDSTGEALIQAALDGGGEDNVSVIVVQVSKADITKPGFQLLYKPDTVDLPNLK